MIKYLFFVFLFHVIFCYNETIDNINNYNTLRLLQVVFRHGDRYPDEYCKVLTPDDPDTYFPDGFGALTTKGKNQEYQIGVALRKRYKYWLESIYTPNILEARSTDYPRTKMSLQLMLAGLFPPVITQIWNWNVNWQPIPYDYEKKNLDFLMSYPTNCPKYVIEWENVLNSEPVLSIINQRKMLIDYVNKNTNKTENPHPRPMEYLFSLYFCFHALQAIGKPIPEWVQPIYPTPLEKSAILEYQLMTFTENLLQYTGGPLLKKIVDDSIKKINGKLPKERKLFVYSGHEFNIATLLRALLSFPPHIPPYGAYILIELHEINNTYGFKIFYQNYNKDEPVPIKIPECDYFCPIDQFSQILGKHFPNSNEICV